MRLSGIISLAAAVAAGGTPALARQAGPPEPVVMGIVAAGVGTPATTIVDAVAEDAAPLLPAGASPGFVPPARDAGGIYATPNRDLSPDEVTWHVRVALNVAALSCRADGTGDPATAYNALLGTSKVPLAAAQAGMAERYKAKYGSAWQARSDDAMTRLYNFFAQPPARDGFCRSAAALLHEAASVEPSSFAAFAAVALPKLEAPFLAFFAAYDDYRTRQAQWQSRHAPKVVIATAAVPRIGPFEQ